MKKLIVGLGNPGTRYKNTRHNIGFVVLDKLASSLELSFVRNNRLNAKVAEGNVEGQKIVLLKPMTMMNLSGDAVAAAAKKFKVDSADIWIVHDDIDLDFGVIRIRLEGSAGGHNGVKSIIERLGTKKFGRFRFGVGTNPANIPLDAWIVTEFSKEELDKITELRELAVKTIRAAIKDGIESDTEKIAE